MDAILFSANTDMVTVDDAIKHLTMHEELYWEVGFRINPNKFSFPILGYIHISKGQVEYRVVIRDIIPFSKNHYEKEDLSRRVKPSPWLIEWRDNNKTPKYSDGIRDYRWRWALVMICIQPFSYDTCQFLKDDGSNDYVRKAPQSYIKVIPPDREIFPNLSHEADDVTRSAPAFKPIRPRLSEMNLEEFVVHRLEEIEVGLRLENRQLSTSAGRLDLLCKDKHGQYVVLELKRSQGTDQVVGQTLRYMGWVREKYGTDKVRGIIVVAKKDNLLEYAIKPVPNIQVKEFKILIK